MKELIIATSTQKPHGFYEQGKVYELIEEDEKRRQIKIVDERGITCW